MHEAPSDHRRWCHQDDDAGRWWRDGLLSPSWLLRCGPPSTLEASLNLPRRGVSEAGCALAVPKGRSRLSQVIQHAWQLVPSSNCYCTRTPLPTGQNKITLPPGGSGIRAANAERISGEGVMQRDRFSNRRYAAGSSRIFSPRDEGFVAPMVILLVETASSSAKP